MCMDGQLWYQLYRKKWPYINMEAQSIDTTKQLNKVHSEYKLDFSYSALCYIAAGSSSIHQGLVWKIQIKVYFLQIYQVIVN